MLTTKQDVVTHILNDKFYEDVLRKYLGNPEERNEFRQELWLILLEMPESKLIGYFNQNCLKYVYAALS